MNSKKAGWLFLCMMLSSLAVSLCMEIVVLVFGIGISIAVSNFIAEMSMFIPAVIFVLCCGDKFSDMIPVKKVKISTALLVPVYLLLCMPLCYFANSITMLFVENTVAAVSDQILAMSLGTMFLSIGVYAPIIEECCYRGVLFQSFKRSGRIFTSIVVSALLFGLMHLNLNQAAYAFLLGIMFAILVEATGSIITSMIAHMLLNSSQVLLLYLESNNTEIMEVANNFSEEEIQSSLIMMIGPFGVAAVIGVAIAMCLAYWMAKNEGRAEYFKSIFVKRGQLDIPYAKENVFSIPLLAGILLCVINIVMQML